MQKTAIIDLGTNTFHLLIAEGQKILSRERIAVKIGKGGINAGTITNEGLQRAIVAMKAFRLKLDEQGVRTVMAFGTSALRNAKNGDEVAKRLQNESGIPVRIISGDEEAEFIYEGVRTAVKMQKQASLIVDIGGGSVEFIIGNDNGISWKQSFEIGAQRLLERFQQHDPITPDEILELKKYLSRELSPLFCVLADFKPKTLIGSSGTFDTLSEMYCIQQAIPYNEEDAETPLSITSFYTTYRQIVVKDRSERMKMPGMIELRVDMIVVACILIDLLFENHEFLDVRVSTYSLKEGVLRSISIN